METGARCLLYNKSFHLQSYASNNVRTPSTRRMYLIEMSHSEHNEVNILTTPCLRWNRDGIIE